MARYPQAWDQLARFRRQKAKLGGWPSWCDVPLSGAYAIVTGGTDRRPDDADVAVVGGIGTWRLSQGIYRYDPDLLEALWTTPIERVPAELLYRLPEWCLYLETPGRSIGSTPLLGAFVWLEWDTHPPHRTELRALLDTADYLYPIILHLTHETLDGCIDAALAEILRHMPETKTLPSGIWTDFRTCLREIWPSLISLVLYLCSQEPDVADESGAARMPVRERPRTREGKLIPASAPAAWVIGARIGAMLRQARSIESAGGTHASPRPHIRRAHFHHYRTGPRSGQQQLVLRWLHPILVGGGDVPVTIHPVKE